MTGYRTVVDSLIVLHNLPSASIGRDRSVGLPARSVTPQRAEVALKTVARERGIALGAIEERPDARIQGIVDQWPVAIDGSRALALGLPPVPSLETILRHYLDDFASPSGGS